MIDELIDLFEDNIKDKEYLSEIYVYLCNLDRRELQYMKNKCANRLIKMNRCVKCGQKLQIRAWEEPHTELDGCPIEKMYEPYCPIHGDCYD